MFDPKLNSHFVIADAGDTKQVVLSLSEVNSLHEHYDNIGDEFPKLKESEEQFHIAYGAYIAQPGKSPDAAIADFLLSKGLWLGLIDGNVCRIIAFHDAINVEPIKLHNLIKIPFACLIQTRSDVVEKYMSGKGALAPCFLRYQGMAAALNIYNRPGIIAIKRVEKRLGTSGPITQDNWREHVFKDRISTTAKAII